MKNNKGEINWMVLCGIGFIFFWFAFLFWSLSEDNKQELKRQQSSYQECKTKTQDIEWCFERSFGVKLE